MLFSSHADSRTVCDASLDNQMMKYSLAEKIQEFSFNILHRMIFFFDKNGPNRLRRKQDSGWSSVMYVCAFVCQAVNIGLILNFGVLFPVIVERFNS